MTELQHKQYLGDGVYAAFDGFQIVLTVEDGISEKARIYLDPNVWLSLEAYVKRINERIKESQT